MQKNMLSTLSSRHVNVKQLCRVHKGPKVGRVNTLECDCETFSRVVGFGDLTDPDTGHKLGAKLLDTNTISKRRSNKHIHGSVDFRVLLGRVTNTNELLVGELAVEFLNLSNFVITGSGILTDKVDESGNINQGQVLENDRARWVAALLGHITNTCRLLVKNKLAKNRV